MSDDRQTIICGARTRRGGRCKNAPTIGSVPPRCQWHNGANHTKSGRPRCKARSTLGRRCRMWAARGSEYCPHHRPRGKAKKEQRCTALTVKGNPCRALAIRDSHPPRCSYHGEPWRRRKRCRARTKRGRRCRARATRKSVETGRPRCPMHAGPRPRPQKEDYKARRQYRRGCQARTTKGKRCSNWAIKGSERRFGRALCSVHAGQAGASATKRCQAQTRAAKRCRNRALAHSKARYGRWLCIFHAAGGLASRPGPQTVVQGKLRCTGRTASGQRCRKWALADGSWPGRSPLCALHAGRDHSQPVLHGYYSQRPHLNAEERAAIARALEEGEPLAAEVLLVRFKLRRLMRYLKREDLPAWRREAAARALFRGLGAVTRLMQARHNLARVRWGPTSGGYAQVQLANLIEEEEE